ncbi:MAG: DNA helicase RecQ [Eggerthellaceae bacterium]|nr:DNA helicase RecQ [Eggerthellaceae bacterium]
MDMQAQETLRSRFGFDSFRPGQLELVDGIVGGRDVMGIMPTGAGKSVCYQVPALMLPGVAIVISPLVSLMHDQVNALVSNGIPAAYLNSQLTPSQQHEVMARALAGEFKLLYIAPERFDDPRFASFAAEAPISLVTVDEAHCVSQWGQDFRPSYLRIASFVASLPKRPPVAAFTATATPRVADDIVRLLEMREPVRVVTGFDRPNLRFEVHQLTDKRKLARIASYALEHAGDSGIVYCSTRKEVEGLHEALVGAGVRATRYHAGLTKAERTANQKAFVNDDAPVMVATNAFGMGIDKSNVRYVIHHNMPGSLEAYYQEAGRAGRDGEPAECLLFWNDSDIATARFFIEQETENEALTREEAEVVRSAQRRRLAAMTGYCMTTDCLRAAILHYFETSHESTSPASSCGNCSNCTDEVDAVDVTLTARAIMRCVHELRGRYGKGVVADVLRGSHNEKVRQFGLTNAKTYGILDESAATVKEIIELLVAGEYLEVSEGRYPLVGLGPRAREAATDEFRLHMKRVRKPAHAKPAKAASAKNVSSTAATLETGEQRELFERLRFLRKQIADGEGVPPYVVFSDAALRGMCVALPKTPDEFLAVSGVGQVKLARYGKVFLAEINR